MEWSRSLAYFVGLIATDGCLSSDRRHIDFTSKDFEMVDMFTAFFGDRNRIGTKGRGGGPQRYFRVQLGSVVFYQRLLSIGLTPRKSLTLGALRIPDHVFPDFLRSHLDGDGTLNVYWDSVFPNSLRCYTRFHSASHDHLEWLQTTVSRLWGLGGAQACDCRVFRLSYAKGASLELLKRIYYANDVPCLLRKRRIADAVLSGSYAEVVKLANTRVSEARAERLGGSTPPLRIPLP